MSAESWKVRVTKDHLVFSAAHFITFNGNICERIHGHNWRVAAEVEGPLDENYYVFDFIALRDGLQKIVNELDHRVLLPTKHHSIKVVANEREVEATFEERRWVFPAEDCILLPVENTTAELIARWIAHRFLDQLTAEQTAGMQALTLEVEENFGQWGSVRIEVE
ncbi:MAG: 6-pyruvoyl tetrahydropterin synthase family protein [Planctomycetaceae bacterium]|nr:6-pyruvoyl tetrahydropterin synthase family protein [Planctomycetaceae bacterium]